MGFKQSNSSGKRTREGRANIKEKEDGWRKRRSKKKNKKKNNPRRIQRGGFAVACRKRQKMGGENHKNAEEADLQSSTLSAFFPGKLKMKMVGRVGRYSVRLLGRGERSLRTEVGTEIVKRGTIQGVFL